MAAGPAKPVILPAAAAATTRQHQSKEMAAAGPAQQAIHPAAAAAIIRQKQNRFASASMNSPERGVHGATQIHFAR